jgi:hypothetical protein
VGTTGALAASGEAERLHLEANGTITHDISSEMLYNNKGREPLSSLATACYFLDLPLVIVKE